MILKVLSEKIIIYEKNSNEIIDFLCQISKDSISKDDCFLLCDYVLNCDLKKLEENSWSGIGNKFFEFLETKNNF